MNDFFIYFKAKLARVLQASIGSGLGVARNIIIIIFKLINYLCKVLTSKHAICYRKTAVKHVTMKISKNVYLEKKYIIIKPLALSLHSIQELQILQY